MERKKIIPVGVEIMISRVTVQDTNYCTTRSSHRKCFQSYFIARPFMTTLNVSHRNEKCLGDVSFYTLDPILTLFRSTSLTSGLLCDHCLDNPVSRNTSGTRSRFDLSLCLLNRRVVATTFTVNRLQRLFFVNHIFPLTF